ncbi:SH3 domain-containing protein [Profundibacter sp.]|uniref:SH3 domain-containing protein n=1 Tax=Profundibacter sp. TaxID=3101071 RepID=UPI003D10EE09
MTIKAVILAATILSAASFTPANAADPYKVIGITAGDSLNVRTGAGTSFADIGDVLLGETVQVHGFDSTGKWAQITWRGQLAYVSSRYLKSIGSRTNTNSGSGNGTASNLGLQRVTGIAANDPDGGLVVRVGPGRSYGRVMVIPNGVGMNVVEISSGGKLSRAVFSDGGTGWVRNSYLTGASTGGTSTPPPSSPPQGNVVLPAVFSVINVAANDVLWVRNAPDEAAAPVTNLQPNAAVTVLEFINNGWAKVTIGQNIGYVKASYLTQGGGVTTSSGMQLGLNCNGAEPFWNLQIATDWTMTYSAMGGSPQVSSLQLANPSPSGPYPFQLSDGGQLNGTLSAQICSDGMSDITYPWKILLNAPMSGSMQALNGCCTLQ